MADTPPSAKAATSAATSASGAMETRCATASSAFLTQVVGDPTLAGTFLPAGRILDIIDIVAGRTAARHAKGPVATVSFESLRIQRPVYHGDLVTVIANIVRVGSSSIQVVVEGFSRDPTLRRDFQVCHAVLVFVAIGEDLRPRKGLARVSIPEALEPAVAFAEQRRMASRVLAQLLQDTCASIDSGELAADDIRDDSVPLHEAHVLERMTIPETLMRFRSTFLPRSKNQNATIFGGDILMEMEKNACAAAMSFARCAHVYTIAMSQMQFKLPIFVSDLIEMEARVVYTRNHSVVVNLDVYVQRVDRTIAKSHSGSFALVTVDKAGNKRPLPVALILQDEDTDSLKRYAVAKHTFYSATAVAPDDVNEPCLDHIPSLREQLEAQNAAQQQ